MAEETFLTSGRKTGKKFSFPVKLDTMLSVNLDVAHLRLTLEFLLEAINEQSLKIAVLEEANDGLITKLMDDADFQDKLAQIDVNKTGISAAAGSIDGLKGTCQDITARYDEFETKVTEMQQEANAQAEQLTELKQAIEGLHAPTNELTEEAVEEGVDPETPASQRIDTRFEALKQEVAQLRSDLGQVRSAEGLAYSNKSELDDLNKHLATAKAEIARLGDELQSKVDCDVFDSLQEQFDALQTSSGSSAPGAATAQSATVSETSQAASLNSRDKNTLKDLVRRMEEIEVAFADHCHTSEQYIKKVVERANKFEKEARYSLDDLKTTRESMLARLDSHDELLRSLDDRLINLPADTGADKPVRLTPTAGVSSKKVDKLVARVETMESQLQRVMNAAMSNKEHAKFEELLSDLGDATGTLKNELDHLRDTLTGRIAILEAAQRDSSNSTANLAELDLLVTSKLEEVQTGLDKKYADRTKTKRALYEYEFQLKKVVEFLMNKKETDEAILTRKPLGGLSCASCEKGLEQTLGRRADHTPWNRMPYRDPTDRIARVGPGFSRMLSTVQPEFISQRTRMPPQGSPPHSTYVYVEEDSQHNISLPPVKKSNRRPGTTLDESTTSN